MIAHAFKSSNGHTDSVYSLILVKDGNLASGSADETIKIWKRENDQCFKTLQCHTGRIWALESKYTFDLISCSGEESIKIWNVTSGECIRTLIGHTHSNKNLLKRLFTCTRRNCVLEAESFPICVNHVFLLNNSFCVFPERRSRITK